LRQIVINCYKYHGREDLLPAFSEDATEETSRPAKVIKTETETEQQQADRTAEVQPPQQQQQQQQHQQQQPPSSQPAQLQQQQNVQQLVQSTPASTAQYAPTVVQTISNPDGTVSIIQVGLTLVMIR
jgi:nuclear respiratory factor 1